jgi:hypothetical protein
MKMNTPKDLLVSPNKDLETVNMEASSSSKTLADFYQTPHLIRQSSVQLMIFFKQLSVTQVR